MVEQTYLLQRNSKEAEALRSISKKELQDFYERFFFDPNTTTTYVLYVSKEPVSDNYRHKKFPHLPAIPAFAFSNSRLFVILVYY